ncbi:MAG: MBL fold metallo-hydrolase [Rubricoccaceae bacterium]|nr:MBL fold metallo-hydrolase [Rubricoccaceae bacterium]
MQEIAPDVHHLALMPFSSVNAYFADGVLFDAGVRSSEAKIRRALGGRAVKAHALTHAHPDHQGASHAVCEALGLPLWVGAADAPVMEGSAPMPMPDNALARLTARAWAGPPHPVARRLAEGDAVGRFTVIETPGHTAGHVVFWDEKARVLVLGDVLRNISYLTLQPGLREPPELFTPDPAQNRASARTLLGLRPKLVLFGHGPPLRDPGRFEAFIQALPE